MTDRRIPLLLSALLLTAGCSGPASEEAAWQADADGNIKAPSASWVHDLLQRHFDANPSCTPFFAMPHDVPADSLYEQKRMQAFIDAGLIHRDGEMAVADPGNGSGERRVIRYTLTPEGEKSIRPGSGEMARYDMVICYGRRTVGKVEVGEVDQTMQGVDVRYRYELKDRPDWVDAPSIRAFYPGLDKWLADREAEGDSATLRFRDGKWAFERPPVPEMFDIRQLGH